MGDVFKIVTKKCPLCGREFFLHLIKGDKVVYENQRVKLLTHCPFDSVLLDFNIHEFSIGGDEFVIDVVKKCPKCKFEIDLYDVHVGDHKVVKKTDEYESIITCPICGSELYVSHHLVIK